MTNTPTPDLSLLTIPYTTSLFSKHDLNFYLHDTELAAALARADAAEALTTEVTRLLAAEVIRLRAECFRLAAGACGGHYGDDYGHSRCSLVDVQRTRAEAAEALLREAAEVLEQVSAAQTRLVYEGIDRGKGHWSAWDDVARAVTAARDLAAKIRGAMT